MTCDCEKPCYVHCAWCGADCELPEPPHAEDCPSVTGIFPVRPEDLGHECVHCHKRTPGMSCPKCKTEFNVGDFFCHQTLEGQPDDVVIVVCLTCAALSPSTQYQDD